MQITIRFLLRNSFYFSDGELTSQMSHLYNVCPTLFDNILPRTDKRDIIDMVAEEELSFEMDISGNMDSNHRRTTVIGRVAVNGITHQINDNNDLPTKPRDMALRFKRALCQVYTNEHNTGEIYQLGNKPLQWANKLAFTDRYVHSGIIGFY
jgi:hypothetical protein